VHEVVKNIFFTYKIQKEAQLLLGKPIVLSTTYGVAVERCRE